MYNWSKLYILYIHSDMYKTQFIEFIEFIEFLVISIMIIEL